MSHINTSALCIIPACAFPIVFWWFCMFCMFCMLPPASLVGCKLFLGRSEASPRSIWLSFPPHRFLCAQDSGPSSQLVMTECFLNNRCQEEEAGCVSAGWLLHVDDDDVSGFLLHAAASLLPRKLSPGKPSNDRDKKTVRPSFLICPPGRQSSENLYIFNFFFYLQPGQQRGNQAFCFFVLIWDFKLNEFLRSALL